MARIVALDVLDVRFPTSRSLDGSDAMNPDPDYSAAYVVVRTDAGDGLEGHGLTFTIGRGTEVVVAGVEALRPLVIGRRMDAVFADMGTFWRELVGDSQLRWIGPEKGVIHLATAAVVNAVWDLFAKTAGKPLWKLLVDMSPAELVELVDWRYIADALSPQEAIERLEARVVGRAAREAELRRDGYPAYTTSVGWLGYDDDKIRRLCREALAEGWTAFKLKVGADVEDDRAIEQSHKTLELSPDFPLAYSLLSHAILAQGLGPRELRQILGRYPADSPNVQEQLAYVDAVSGDRPVKRAFLAWLGPSAEERHIPPVTRAVMCAALGEHSQALDWLEKAYALRDSQLIWLNVSPMFDSLRSEPRFVDLVRRIGLSH
jgi:hypothetical protein